MCFCCIIKSGNEYLTCKQQIAQVLFNKLLQTVILFKKGENIMRIPRPFIPLRAESHNLNHTVHISGRDYTFGADGMLTSVLSQGHELLAEPVRLVMQEDGNPSVWKNNYPQNESASFVQRRNDEEIVICGAKQSKRFVIDLCNTVSFDGNIDIDLKLMATSLNFKQVYGIEPIEEMNYTLDKLWLEIPLKASESTLFHMYRNTEINSEMKYADGTVDHGSPMSSSGKVPDQSVSISFKPLLWLGNEERGFCWFAPNNRYWQPETEGNAMEIIRDGEAVILRVRLLDSQPRGWEGNPKEGNLLYRPIEFHFGFHVTPVKEFPKQPYLHNAFHLDCGSKIEGNYLDYMCAENRFDRLVEKGVTTLILHEKWNTSQNWFELSEPSSHLLKFICDECHKRGIKVLPYFGFELATMSPEWSSKKENVLVTRKVNQFHGGHWRVPFQRNYGLCFNTECADWMIDGVKELMDTYHIDGIYLDSTVFPRYCEEVAHGCGWYDYDGNLHGSYPFKALRRLFRNLYDTVDSRGGIITVHSSGVLNYTAAPYIHQFWFGEVLQKELMKGNKADVNLDYFRAEYIGRNAGVPVEFIVYENRPYWDYETALSISLIHGVLPRPNNIYGPLDTMSSIWKIFDAFPIEKSQWKPYWNNNAKVSNEKVRVSYYKYTTLMGKAQLLAFVANISPWAVDNVTVAFDEDVSLATDMSDKAETGFTFDLPPYGHKILFIE